MAKHDCPDCMCAEALCDGLHCLHPLAFVTRTDAMMSWFCCSCDYREERPREDYSTNDGTSSRPSCKMTYTVIA